MGRARRFTPPPPDEAEHITGDGVIDVFPTDDGSRDPRLEPVEFLQSMKGPSRVLTPAEDRAPGAVWYDYGQSVPAVARKRHGLLRARVLAEPGCGPHAAVVIDLWADRPWKSADEFVAAVAAATGLPAKKAEREARKVLREYYLLTGDLD